MVVACLVSRSTTLISCRMSKRLWEEAGPSVVFCKLRLNTEILKFKSPESEDKFPSPTYDKVACRYVVGLGLVHHLNLKKSISQCCSCGITENFAPQFWCGAELVPESPPGIKLPPSPLWPTRRTLHSQQPLQQPGRESVPGGDHPLTEAVPPDVQLWFDHLGVLVSEGDGSGQLS